MQNRFTWKMPAVILAVLTLLFAGFTYRNYQQNGSDRQSYTEAELKLYYSYPDLESSVAALKKNPNDAAAYRGLAKHYAMKLDHAKTIENLRKAVGVEPDNDHNKSLLAGSLQNDKQYVEAAKLYRQIESHDSREALHAKTMLDRMKSRGQIP